MRSISLLVAGTILASCTASVQQPTRSAEAQKSYQRLVGGKIAQAPISCLPTYQANDMQVIDDNTIAFKVGGTVYINHPKGGCSQLGSGHTALVTRQYGGPGLCNGDIAQVVDTLSRMTVGSCVFGEFTPYVKQPA